MVTGVIGANVPPQSVANGAPRKEPEPAPRQSLVVTNVPLRKPSGTFRSTVARPSAAKPPATRTLGTSSPGTAAPRTSPVTKRKATVTMTMSVLETWYAARTIALLASLPSLVRILQTAVRSQKLPQREAFYPMTAVENASAIKEKATVIQMMTVLRALSAIMTTGGEKTIVLQVSDFWTGIQTRPISN